MKKVVLYARSSINTQKNSIDMQTLLAMDKAKSLNLLFDEQYIDEAVSAALNKVEDRSEFNRLNIEIKADNISTIFVYKRDRLARNVQEHMDLYELLKEKQVNVIFTASNEIPIQYSAAGEFFELMMAGFNQRESQQIKQRIKETKYTLTKMGKNAGGKLPFGYKTNNKKEIEIDTINGDKIKKLFYELIHTSCSGFQEFVDDMNSLEPKLKKTDWSYTRLKSLFENPRYKGIRYLTEDGIKIEFENESLRIINEEDWDAAQEKLIQLITRRTKEPLSSNVVFSLNNVLFCEKCKELMTTKAKKTDGSIEVAYYYCKKHPYNKIFKNVIEPQLFEFSKQDMQNEFKSNFKIVFDIVYQHELKSCSKNIAECKQLGHQMTQDLLVLTQAWVKSKSQETKEQMLEIYNSFEINNTALEYWENHLKKIEQLPKKLSYFLNVVSLNDAVDILEEQQKKVLFEDLIYKIFAYKDKLRITFKYLFEREICHELNS